jgi:hypothetical protein
MLKYLLILLTATSLYAQEGPKGPPPGNRPPRPALTEEQKKQRDAIVAKYDTNKDGKLDREERSGVSEEDRKTLRSFGPPPGGPRRGPGGPYGPRKDVPPAKKEVSACCSVKCECC